MEWIFSRAYQYIAKMPFGNIALVENQFLSSIIVDTFAVYYTYWFMRLHERDEWALSDRTMYAVPCAW